MTKLQTALLTVIAVCLVLVGSVRAGTSTFMGYGPTVESCGTFTASTGIDQQQLKWWLLGFVSGAGRESAGLLRDTDSKGLIGWMMTYCTDHPLERFVTAAILLVDELKTSTK